MSDFEKDRDYNLTVVIDTIAGNIVSDTYNFSKLCSVYACLLVCLQLAHSTLTGMVRTLLRWEHISIRFGYYLIT